MTEKTKILVLGATGYIGGSILTELIDRGLADSHEISALVRKPYHASILKDQGINPIIFKDLDDFDTIRDAAKDHDIVVAAASARHEGCAKACLMGLGERQKSTGKVMHYIHTSGASMVGDWPITKKRVDTKVYSDKHDNIFEIEKEWPDSLSPVRKVNQFVVDCGEQEDVKTYVVPPPLIFGPGTGFFTLGFGQVHMVAQLALKKKQSVMIGHGEGIWSRIHIKDLSNLYYLLTQAVLDGKKDLPNGKAGYYFTENGDQSWKFISEKIGLIGKELGVFDTDEVASVTLQEAADEFYDGDLIDAEAVLASNARTKADNARDVLGWTPAFGESEFHHEIIDVVSNMASQED
ncbi:NAD dependent epimerase/dehydratase family protein [Mollisia scopiformis]|uniref:NAD dependent epimerase/dehydratase family protein n=1 Tax=Mollisia scopiformis TaxID=149040 RepID=A0A194XSK0_MOLSC|nr:NAD dependent epimerase/dehydratase family protein [Mollisia scopiformis]KUJ22707.1 NAD dependent epimerase/dehydratase family protein [Mollisia scopiformis]